MGFFDLFKKQQPRPKALPRIPTDTPARKRIVQYVDSAPTGPREHQLAAMPLYTIASFRFTSNPMAQNIEEFNGDAPLFEFGCYWMFLVDLWYSQHSPAKRSNDVNYVMDAFALAFSDLLDMKTANTLLNSRLAIYAPSQRQEDPTKYGINHLSGLIASSGKMPKIYDKNTPPPMSLGATSHLFMTTAIGDHVIAFWPPLAQALKNYN